MLFFKTSHRGSQRQASHCGFDGWLTCSGAACWTAWAKKPLVSGSSRCWSSCRCDFAAPARSACSSAARPSASSAPDPAWKLQGKKEIFELWFHLHMPDFKLYWTEVNSAILGHLFSVVILSCCGILVRYVPVWTDCFRARSLFLLSPPCRWWRSVCAASAGFWRGAFSRPCGFASLLILR